jgi:hypothetical protein
MPLFPRIDPDLRALVAYIVARARSRDCTLTRTKLVKLLYLIDVERVRSRRDPLTGLEWVFYHYGPYAFELINTLDEMESGPGLVASPYYDSILYRAAPGAPDGENWNAATKNLVDNVIDEYASRGLNELLDYVYFQTGPMVGAQRGQRLDLSRAQEGSRRRLKVSPLRAPSRPPDIDERLARWRARNARSLSRIVLDPPGRFLDYPGEDLGGEGVGGVLRVPEDSEL